MPVSPSCRADQPHRYQRWGAGMVGWGEQGSGQALGRPPAEDREELPLLLPWHIVLHHFACAQPTSLPASHCSGVNPPRHLPPTNEPLRTSHLCSQLRFTGLHDLSIAPKLQPCGSKPQAPLRDTIHLSSSGPKEHPAAATTRARPTPTAIAELPSKRNGLSRLHTTRTLKKQDYSCANRMEIPCGQRSGED